MFLKSKICLWLLMATLSSCITYKEVEMTGVESYKIERFDARGAEIEVVVRVANPNAYKIKVTHSDLDLYLNGKPAGKATIKKKIVMPRQSDMSHSFIIACNFSELAGGVGSLVTLFTGGKIVFETSGWIKAKAFGIGKKIPIDYSDKISL